MATSIFDLCKQRGISLLEVAERSGLDLVRVRAIYLGRWTPNPTERQKLADVFGVSVDDITWGHQTPIQHIYGHGPG
jgi:transcriptional regulator with XRE-family HTH domain